MNSIAVILSLAACVSAQNYGTYGTYGSVGGVGGSGSAIVFPNNVPSVVRPSFPVGQPVVPGSVVVGSSGLGSHGGSGGCNAQSLVHARSTGSDYHFSWCSAPGQIFTFEGAKQFCQRLGFGWQPISIETQVENQFVKQSIVGQKYIWTSGHRSGYNFVWGSGNQFVGLDWSHTGLDGLPQPDNRENGAENCLAVLNNFYNDGIRWHDIACHHEKPVICEKVAAPSPVYG